ncbi:hypothetical protein BDE02_15G001400 [Populus trichocarpa]|nr:hypothetical protein BDE02_15G001400 [Populus trichocarpa]
MIYPKKKMMMMMMIPSTLLIHFLLIASIALFSAPTVRSDANPIRLPTLDHNNNNDDDDDACGEWSRRSPVSSCPVKCFRPDPVCGVDGVTYWCGCDDARCAGTKVTKKGFCESLNFESLRPSSVKGPGGSILLGPHCFAHTEFGKQLFGVQTPESFCIPNACRRKLVFA